MAIKIQDNVIVTSKIKKYIKQVADMNTAAEVIVELHNHVRNILNQAKVNAHNDGRKTVMARDIKAVLSGVHINGNTL